MDCGVCGATSENPANIHVGFGQKQDLEGMFLDNVFKSLKKTWVNSVNSKL